MYSMLRYFMPMRQMYVNTFSRGRNVFDTCRYFFTPFRACITIDFIRPVGAIKLPIANQKTRNTLLLSMSTLEMCLIVGARSH